MRESEERKSLAENGKADLALQGKQLEKGKGEWRRERGLRMERGRRSRGYVLNHAQHNPPANNNAKETRHIMIL